MPLRWWVAGTSIAEIDRDLTSYGIRTRHKDLDERFAAQYTSRIPASNKVELRNDPGVMHQWDPCDISQHIYRRHPRRTLIIVISEDSFHRERASPACAILPPLGVWASGGVQRLEGVL